MKLSEFYNKPRNKSEKPQVLAFNNEAKEAQMTAKVVDLEAKIGRFEAQIEENSSISGQLQAQRDANQGLLSVIEENGGKITFLEAQVQEKQRLLDEIGTLQRSNDQLMTSHGEMTTSLSAISIEFSNQMEELVHLREANTSLTIARQSLFTESLNKDSLLQEVRVALADLKDKHEELSSFSNALGQQYEEVVETKNKLDKNTLELTQKLVSAQQTQEEFKIQERYNIEKNTESITARVRNTMNKQTEQLQQNVKDLTKLTAYYKTELSKPQHMSVSAIARQEGFKIPLASSAVNYRKNNLGTGQATLLKFGNKES